MRVYVVMNNNRNHNENNENYDNLLCLLPSTKTNLTESKKKIATSADEKIIKY